MPAPAKRPWKGNFRSNYDRTENSKKRQLYVEDPCDPEQRPYDRTQWKEIRPYIYDIIKGKQAPSSFHFVLMLKPEHVTALLEQAGESQLDAFVQSFLITVRFSDSVMTIVTGTAYKSFTLDKSADTLWDKSLQKFLTSRQIDFELMS